MPRLARVLIVAIGSAALASPVNAQADEQRSAGAASQPPQRTCFRGRPASWCRAFWLTEAGYYWRAAGTGFVDTTSLGFPRQHLGSHATWEVGGMVNRTRAAAVGATLLIGYDSRGPRVGVKGRYRRWLPDEATVDMSAGLLKAVAYGPWPILSRDARGATADVSLGRADLVAVTVRVDMLHVSGGQRAGAIYGGVRLGSYPAVLVTAALVAYAAVVLTAVLGGGGDS